MLIPMGKEKVVLKSEIVGALVNVFLNSLFIPKLGAEGAAIGTLVAEFSVLLVQVSYLKKELCEAFFKFKWFSFFISLFIGASIGFVVRQLLSNIFINIFVGAVIFGLCLFVWLINSRFLTERVGIQIKR